MIQRIEKRSAKAGCPFPFPITQARWHRVTSLASALLCSTCWIALGFAASPEPSPTYSHSKLLRGDASLHGVAFVDDRHGVACGDRGTILTTDDGGQSWTIRSSGVDCRLSDVVWINERRLIVIGGGYDRITRISRAVVLTSDDGGIRWRQIPADDLPRLGRLERRRDGSLIAIGDWSHAMLTNRFQSHDDGKTWIADLDHQHEPTTSFQPTPEQLAKWADGTGLPVAIRDACRIDQSTLLAVGDHGVILVSPDGGRNWSAQRGAGRSTAVLMVARDRASVAWGLLGKEAIEHRNRVSVLIQNTHHDAPGLASQVAVMLGGAGADAMLAAESEMDTVSRQWIAVRRPGVLLIDQSLDVAAQDAFIKAATAAGVTRVVVYRHGTGPNAIHRDALLPNSGVLVSDFATDAQQYVAPHESVSPSISLQYHYDVAAGTRRGDSITAGVQLQPGQMLTASLPPASRRQLQIIQARRSQSTRVQKLIAAKQSPNQFAQSLTTMLNQTARADQFRLAWSVLLETAKQPDNPAAIAYQQASLQEIQQRFPATSAGQWARLLSRSRRHSAEWNRLSESIGRSANSLEVVTANAVSVSPFQDPSGEVRQASASVPLLVPKPDIVGVQQTVEAPIGNVDLSWEFHPLVLIAREAARQRGDHGQLQSADQTSSELKRLSLSRFDRWSPLVRRQSRQSIVARRAVVPPKLDGILNDPCWSAALTQAAETNVRFSYDDEFVYVAFQSSDDQIRPDVSATVAAQRSRDLDLSGVDRLQLMIDTDRDLLTSFQFFVSGSGQTNDSIDGNLAWNPTWYRQVHRADGRIAFEMAILRRELADLPIHAGESWYVSAQPVAAGQISKQTAMPDPEDWLRVDFR
jgi:photosystem II stability/assembly factor-like uncharacterized protein